MQSEFSCALGLHRAGRFEDAVIRYKAATRAAPARPEAFYGLAAALDALGSAEQAAVARSAAVRLRTENSANSLLLAEVLMDVKQYVDASSVLSMAAQHHHDARVLALNGRALLALKHYGPAAGALVLALEIRPQDAAIHLDLESALFHLGRFEDALAHAVQALQIDDDPVSPTTFRAVLSLSAVMIALGRHRDALDMANLALALQPGHAEALSNHSLALDGLGRFEEAVISTRKAMAVAPGSPSVRFNLAMLLLNQGQLTPEAWGLFEARLWLTGTLDWYNGRIWQGEDIAKETILLRADQGLGDTLQFVRYAALMTGRAKRVILVVQKPLLRLLRQVPGVEQVVAEGTTLPTFDLLCPLASLPGLLETTMDSIPAALPYADLYERWDDGVAGLRVGLVWAGNKDFAPDRHRSINPAQLEVLAGISHVRFYSLQYDGYEALPLALDATDLMDGVKTSRTLPPRLLAWT